MAEPLGSRLRTARPRDLTSPDPVRTPHARQGHAHPGPAPRTPDKPQKRQRRETHTRKRKRQGLPHPEFRRWIEAKP